METPTENRPKLSRKQQYVELFNYSTVGIEMGVAVGIGVFIGYLVDFKVFDGKTSPGFTLFFMAMGLAAAAKAFIKAARELRAKARRAEEDGGGPDQP